MVLKGATCEWSTESDCLTVRVPAGLVAKAGHVPSNGGTASEEKASLPVSLLYSIGPKPVSCGIPFGSRLSKSYLTFVFLAVVVETLTYELKKIPVIVRIKIIVFYFHTERENVMSLQLKDTNIDAMINT